MTGVGLSLAPHLYYASIVRDAMAETQDIVTLHFVDVDTDAAT